jgi:general secretion pathway protein D
MARANKRRVAVAALLLFASGCVTSGALRAGQRAELAQDYDRAIVEYTKALREHPENRETRQALERAKQRSALDHLTRGRRLHAGGRIDEALIELQIAGELNPGNADIFELLATVRTQLRNKVAVAREGRTELETLIERTRNLPPAGQELPGVRMPDSLVYSGSVRELYQALAKVANVSIVFDPQFTDRPIEIDLRNASLEEALKSVAGATRSFFRVSGQRTITIIPDTPAKRQEYEEEVVKVFYLSNADVKETADLLRVVVDARRLAASTANNTITMKDTPERISAAERVIAAIDKARPELVIDVELLEVDRTRLLEYGLQIASPESPGISGGANVGSPLTLRDLRSLRTSDVLLTNLPGLFYRLLKQDGNTRTLANPQIRASEGMKAEARFGERVPVPVTTFAPFASGGAPQQPITSFNYENIGVNIDITPRTHHDDQVTLVLRIEVSSISGTGFGDLPTFGSRAISTTIRLHDGETNLLAGLIRDDEREVMSGIPGLSDLPIVGRLFAHSRKETKETDIVLTLTPRIVRVLDLTEADLRAFRVGAADRAGGIVDLPIPPGIVIGTTPQPQPQPAQQPPPQEAPAPAQPRPAEPILPPPPSPPPPGR